METRTIYAADAGVDTDREEGFGVCIVTRMGLLRYITRERTSDYANEEGIFRADNDERSYDYLRFLSRLPEIRDVRRISMTEATISGFSERFPSIVRVSTEELLVQVTSMLGYWFFRLGWRVCLRFNYGVAGGV